MSFYEGYSLTRYLGPGFPRQDGESDWEYRKRVFPELYLREGFSTAVSVLMGCSVTELSDVDKMVLGCLSRESIPVQQMNSRERKQFLYQLKNFARGFPEDPLKTRVQERVPPEPQLQSKPPQWKGILRRIRLFFCGS